MAANGRREGSEIEAGIAHSTLHTIFTHSQVVWREAEAAREGRGGEGGGASVVKALEPERASFRPSVARAYSVAASVSVRANAFLSWHASLALRWSGEEMVNPDANM